MRLNRQHTELCCATSEHIEIGTLRNACNAGIVGELPQGPPAFEHAARHGVEIADPNGLDAQNLRAQIGPSKIIRGVENGAPPKCRGNKVRKRLELAQNCGLGGRVLAITANLQIDDR